MSGHWRLALRCAAWAVVLAIPAAVAITYLYGGAHAGAFLYGVGTGILSFVSTALTVSLLAGRSRAAGMVIGGISFVARYGFAAVALGVPAYLGLWPVVAMLGGFGGVYLAESAVLLPGMMMTRSARRSVGKKVERRVEA